jgi:hypothetical protein
MLSPGDLVSTVNATDLGVVTAVYPTATGILRGEFLTIEPPVVPPKLVDGEYLDGEASAS